MPRRHLLLGAFFFVIVAILAYYTLFMTDFRLFGETITKRIWFPGAAGLRQGDSVLVAGVRWGKIESLEFHPEADGERRIEVVVTLEEAVTLREGYSIRIKDATLLGGKNLAIDPGPASAPEIPPDEELRGEVASNVLEALDDIVAENREALTNTLQNVESLVSGVREGRGIIGRLFTDEELAERVSETIGSAAESFANVEELTTGLGEGRGTLGRLFTDETLYDRIDALSADLSRIASDVRSGRGTIGRLLYDEDTSSDVGDAVAAIRDITTRLRDGEGTLGRLLTDDTLARNLESLTNSLTGGEGTLGRLLTDDALFEDISRIAANLADVSDTLRRGEGTLGKLVFEDDLYVELERALTILTGSLEEAREAAPISTFLNTVFLGF